MELKPQGFLVLLKVVAHSELWRIAECQILSQQNIVVP